MKKLLFIALILVMNLPVFAVEVSSEKQQQQPALNVDLNSKLVSFITFESLSNAMNNINQNSENSLEGFQRATTRYSQTNVVAAYKDFSKIINSSNGKNDFLFITMAQRLDNMGFFTLSQAALINLEDAELWRIPISSLKKIYNPSVTLTYDEEMYLAKLYTLTLYDNSANEVIKELESNEKILKKSDYANYILAVAYFENKNYSKALTSINKAISKAPECVNYMHFKEKIYTQSGNYKSAMKIIKDLEKINLSSTYFKDVLNNDKLYILMKTSKKDKAKLYSAKLLFQTGDYTNALKEAQATIAMNKKNLEAYILIGDYYVRAKEIEKAKDYYEKAYSLKKKYSPALLGLGHYYYVKKNYPKALEYYKTAYKYAPNDEQTLLSLSNSLIVKGDKDEAAFYLKKAIKLNPNSDGVYYLMSKLIPNVKEQNLRISVGLNPTNIHAWLDLAEIKINQKDYKKAQEYLFPVKMIEPNNKRYYELANRLNKYSASAIKTPAENLIMNKNTIRWIF